ncbi:sugar phosphate isomerase/epimerase [Sphingomonas sp. SORGH_AS802]|uniref:sugar phosphate isomerase/epimerase family protein n=1 Tax=unclassified Sphingomonas TaxID=196159 RepID=UPI0028613A05|nr:MULTISPECIES: sugar phosphate isomerase/epimerase family protein [unclassified Sphingomonas]MDR6128206.1 sugar phosphate isomerase/epimerase [Sphingomonas sp. SORGH_AS_0438]MDR6135590.1 sugar phosphate isomerase/epimerase [Sphingomonas sp. SORGH_AS_0802]
MKFAVSNIAWPVDRLTEAYAILRDHGVTGLEIAPGLFFAHAADPFRPSSDEVGTAIDAVRDAGLELVSMQSLLFGVADAALFEGADARETLVAAMHRAIDLAGRLAIPTLVFGSPRQRQIPATLDEEQAAAIAIDLFRTLGDRAASCGTRIAMEPNPAAYGTNFLNRMEEADAFVRRVDHPAIVLNFDIGALHMEGDFARIERIAADTIDRIGHVHISEPQLAPAPADVSQAAHALRVLRDAGYQGWYSIEMKAAMPDSLDALRRSLDILEQAVQEATNVAA